MSDETWMDARKAVELGFADEIMFAKPEGGEEDEGRPTAKEPQWGAYSSRAMGQAIINRLVPARDGNAGTKETDAEAAAEEKYAVSADVDPVIGVDGRTQDGSMPYELLKKQLELLR